MGADALLSALKDGVAIETAGKEFDLTPQSTGFFKRNGSIPNIGFERELSRAAFELSDESSLPQEVFQGGKVAWAESLSDIVFWSTVPIVQIVCILVGSSENSPTAAEVLSMESGDA